MLTAKNDRRVFRRMEIEAGVKIMKGDTELQGVCKDLSSTGMSIELTQSQLKEGDQIQVMLATQDSRFPPLNADATVLRTSEQNGDFIVSVQFLTVK